MKRGRNQRRRPSGGSNPNRALDSNGPDVRIRGTATQIYDKYQALARDASSSGDRVKAESYLQHAEHYFRVIRSMQPAQGQNHVQGAHDSENDQPGFDDGDHNDHQRDQRPQRDHHNRPAVESDSGHGGDEDNGDGEEAAAVPSAAGPSVNAGEEDRKTRRRRAPRRPAKKDEDEKDKAPAAAE